MIKRIHSHQGFTLVEVLVSIALIGITAVSIMGLYTTSLQNNIHSKEVIETTVRSKDIMENIKNALASGNKSKDDILQEYMNSNAGIIVTIEEENFLEDISGILYIIEVSIEGSQESIVSKIYVPENKNLPIK